VLGDQAFGEHLMRLLAANPIDDIVFFLLDI
jgi:hypothetical protein